MTEEGQGEATRRRRRTVLAAVGSGTLAGLAGCGGILGSGSSGIGGLRLALRADGEVTTDSEGRVETWVDGSDEGNDFSTPRPASRPTLTEDAVGGSPALTFDGDDDYLLREDTLGIPDDGARTVVVACRLAETTPRSPFFVQGTLGSAGEESNHYGLEANTFNTAGERFGVYLVSVGHDAKRATDTGYHVHTLRTGSFPGLEGIRESTTYYVDGAETAFAHSGGGTFNDTFRADASAVGAFPAEETGDTHHGEIAEVRVYDRALPAGDRETVESEVADRYGIDLG